MGQYFREPEGAKDQARRWWRLVKERSLSVQDRAEELDRLRNEVGNDKEWRMNIRRTAGRNHQESLLMDPRIEWTVKPEPQGLTQIAKLFQTAGIQTARKLEEAMTQAFETTEDGLSSYWALKELKDFRIVSKEKWQEWNTLVRSRFKEQPHQIEDDQAGKVRLKIKETIDLLREVKRGRKECVEEAASWMPRLKEELEGAVQRSLELTRQHARPRLKAPRRLWILGR
jgi:hypothetical protein